MVQLHISECLLQHEDVQELPYCRMGAVDETFKSVMPPLAMIEERGSPAGWRDRIRGCRRSTEQVVEV